MQHVHEVHPAQHGGHRVPEQRHRRRRTGYTHFGPVAVGPCAVHVRGTEKRGDQQHFQVEQFVDEFKHYRFG